MLKSGILLTFSDSQIDSLTYKYIMNNYIQIYTGKSLSTLENLAKIGVKQAIFAQVQYYCNTYY
ncbi:MAG: hypothetical protein NVS4B11_28890 [Ktedonobacteraceae bacterium]